MELGNQNQMRNQIGISPFSRIQSSRDSRISLPFYSKSQLLVRSKAGNLYNSYTTCILLESRQVRRQNASKTRERSPCPTYLPIQVSTSMLPLRLCRLAFQTANTIHFFSGCVMSHERKPRKLKLPNKIYNGCYNPIRERYGRRFARDNTWKEDNFDFRKTKQS